MGAGRETEAGRVALSEVFRAELPLSHPHPPPHMEKISWGLSHGAEELGTGLTVLTQGLCLWRTHRMRPGLSEGLREDDQVTL